MSLIEGDLRVSGQLTAGTLKPSAGSVTNASVDAAADIAATKLEHRHQFTYRQKTGTAIVSATEDVYTVHGVTGEVVAVDVVATTAPTGGDKAFTVDVQKGNQSTAFATVLTGVVTVDNSKADRQVVAGSLVGSPSTADGDTLRVVVAASGATGTQGQGLVVTITVREKAD